jgi:signal transduction histidine kinase
MMHGGSWRGVNGVIVLSEAKVEQLRRLGRSFAGAPFTRRTWSELLFFTVSAWLSGLGLAFLALTFFGGVALSVTFVGLFVVGASIRAARGIGGWHRSVSRRILGTKIEEPEPFEHRPGVFGWLQAVLRDRTGWRAMAYAVLSSLLAFLGVLIAWSTWWDAATCLTYPIWNNGGQLPHEFGAVVWLFPPGYLSVGTDGGPHALFIFVTGVLLFFVAPWPMRLVVAAQGRLQQALLSPDPVTARMRSLEQARTQTVDTSAAVLRRIERDLHDGTQAQLVALAMRLGQAKEALENGSIDLGQVRRLVDEAHTGAKEAIVELRDLARGIHPPALDIGLEGALSTLAARSPVPTQLTVTLDDRPTPAIEAIAYFCVAELLANVAQHAEASRASIMCTQHGAWLRVVVRDDGRGGAQLAQLGSSSSGLAGLTDRVYAVDGRLHIVSPSGGPTVVTVDLPLHA